MPLYHTMRCDACGAERDLWSDSTALQLDDGTTRPLGHPGEEGHCRRFGLTLRQASERGRLFHRTYLVCRSCGRDGEAIARARRESASLDDPKPWSLVLPCVGVAAIAVPIALWLRWQTLAFVVGITALASPLIDVHERWKAKRERSKHGEPDYPTPDAPGRTAIAAPEPPPPCCDRPDLIEVATLTRDDRIPCSACGSGTLEIVGGGLA